MKVALVVETLDLTRPGVAQPAWELAGALQAQGVSVTIIAGSAESEGVSGNAIAVVDLGVKGWSRTGRWHRFNAALETHLVRSHYDMVHALAPVERATVYQPAGNSLYPMRRYQIRGELDLYGKSDGPVVVASSGPMAGRLRRDHGLSQERIALVPDGVAVESFASPAIREKGAHLRRLIDPEDNLALLLFVGDDFKRQGLEWLIRAAAQARAQRQSEREFRLLVAGPDDFTGYWEQARASGMQGRVLFLGQSRELGALYGMVDGVVLPAQDDRCRRVALEALVAGVPVVTACFEGARELLAEGRYGMIIEPCHDDQMLAGAIRTLCDQGRCREYKDRIVAGQLADSLSVVRQARELFGLYQRLIMRK